MADAAATPRFTIVPANEASCEALQTVLGRGCASRCQCQRHKTRGREWDAESVPVDERAARLREQTNCGQPDARTTSGLVAYLDGEPVGWCAVEPHSAYVRIGPGRLLDGEPASCVRRVRARGQPGRWARRASGA